MKIIIGSRGSSLALKQTEEIKNKLLKLNNDLNIEIKIIHTKGDKILDKPLNKIGDKGLFTKEIEEKLLNEEIDLAVHSMKDMPSILPDGLILGGTVLAEDFRDCLVFNNNYKSIDDLPKGAIIGTGSLRRKYQLLKYRSDLNFVDIRGNIGTRLEKMVTQNMSAIVLASAGLKRLGLENKIGQYLDLSIMVPACNQGILALELKKNSKILPIIEKIYDKKTTERMQLERLFLETISGGCHLPLGCNVKFLEKGIEFYAILGDEFGKKLIKHYEIIENNFEENIRKIAINLKKKVFENE